MGTGEAMTLRFVADPSLTRIVSATTTTTPLSLSPPLSASRNVSANRIVDLVFTDGLSNVKTMCVLPALVAQWSVDTTSHCT